MSEQKTKEECDKTGEFEVKTPLGSFTSRGKRNAEIIAALSLAAMLVLAYIMWNHSEDTVRARVDRNKQMDALSGAIKEFAAAQREMACIISLPQDKREAEYRSPFGLCKRMGVP